MGKFDQPRTTAESEYHFIDGDIWAGDLDLDNAIIGYDGCRSRPIMERPLQGGGRFSDYRRRPIHRSNGASVHRADAADLWWGCHTPVHSLEQVGVHSRAAAVRATFATAAESLVAETNIAFAVGVLTAIGILVLSLVMLKGIFQRRIAYLGIVTGILGIFSEGLRTTIGASYIFYGILLTIWFIVIGWRLYGLARD